MPRSIGRPLRAAAPSRHSGGGFVLPIAIGAALLLVLSSGSLHGLALQRRVQVAQLHQRHQLEDVLASAVQQQLGALQAAGSGCLLAVDLPAWGGAAPTCGIAADQLTTLQQGAVGASRYRLTRYTVLSPIDPANGTGVAAELEVQLNGPRPWKAGYRVTLQTTSGNRWQISAVQELGLRGAQA